VSDPGAGRLSFIDQETLRQWLERAPAGSMAALARDAIKQLQGDLDQAYIALASGDRETVAAPREMQAAAASSGEDAQATEGKGS